MSENQEINKAQEVVVYEDKSPQIGGNDMDAVIEAAEHVDKYVKAYNRIISSMVKLTNPGDWIDMGGKPYLSATGAEKVANPFGISWSFPEGKIDCENLDGGHKKYTCKVHLTMGNRSIDNIGTRSSTDPFYAKKGGKDKDISEIDMADVEKGAYTNAIGGGISKIMGIRNLTWEQLGMKAGAKVDYDGRNESSKTDKEVDAIKKEIFNMLQDLCSGGYEHDGTSYTEPQELLVAVTKSGKFKGWTSLQKMTAKGAEITHRNLSKIHQEFESSIGDAKEPDEELPFTE